MTIPCVSPTMPNTNTTAARVAYLLAPGNVVFVELKLGLMDSWCHSCSCWCQTLPPAVLNLLYNLLSPLIFVQVRIRCHKDILTSSGSFYCSEHLHFYCRSMYWKVYPFSTNFWCERHAENPISCLSCHFWTQVWGPAVMSGCFRVSL